MKKTLVGGLLFLIGLLVAVSASKAYDLSKMPPEGAPESVPNAMLQPSVPPPQSEPNPQTERSP